MTTPLLLRADRAVPVAHDEALARVLPMPLELLFARRFAAIPAIREVRDQHGEWGTSGQTRTVVLADGGTMRETLTEVASPERFGYRIDAITGPMKLLVGGALGTWRFEPAGTGTRITWQWEVTAANAVAALALPAFGVMWRGYARLALERLETLLLDTA